MFSLNNVGRAGFPNVVCHLSLHFLEAELGWRLDQIPRPSPTQQNMWGARAPNGEQLKGLSRQHRLTHSCESI